MEKSSNIGLQWMWVYTWWVYKRQGRQKGNYFGGKIKKINTKQQTSTNNTKTSSVGIIKRINKVSSGQTQRPFSEA